MRFDTCRFRKPFHPDIKDFKLFVLTDGKSGSEPIINAKFKDTEDLQSFLNHKVNARYFKFEGLSGYTRKAAAVGEILFCGTSGGGE